MMRGVRVCLLAAGWLGSCAVLAAEDTGRVAFTVAERAGVPTREWPVTTTIPLAEGRLRASTVEQGRIRVLRPDGAPVPTQAKVTARWGRYPWGASVYARFVQVTFLADLLRYESSEYALEWGSLIAPPAPKPLSVTRMVDAVVIRSGQGPNQLLVVIEGADYHSLFDTIVLDQKGDGFTDDLPLVGPGGGGAITVARSLGRAVSTLSLGGPAEIDILESGPLRARLEVHSQFADDLGFRALYTFFAGQPYVFVETALATQGDEGSDTVRLGAYRLSMPLAISETADVTCGTGDALAPDRWLSTWTTIEPDKPVYLRQRGPREGETGAWGYSFGRGYEEKAFGDRAPGWLDIRLQGRAFMLACRDFWLGGPKSMEAANGAVSVQLLPEQGLDGGHALAPGESLSTELLFCFPYDACPMPSGDVAAAFAAPVGATVSPQEVCASQAFSAAPLRAIPADLDPLKPAADILLGRSEQPEDEETGLEPLDAAPPPAARLFSSSLRASELQPETLEADGAPTHDMLQALVLYHVRTGDPAALDLALALGRRLTRSPRLQSLVLAAPVGLASYAALADDPWGVANIERALTYTPTAFPPVGPHTTPLDWARRATVAECAWRVTWDAAWIDALAEPLSAFSQGVGREGVWWGMADRANAIRPAESDSITLGLQSLLAAELGADDEARIDAAIIARADVLLARGIEHETGFLNNRYQLRKWVPEGLAAAGVQPPEIEDAAVGFEAMLTMAAAYGLTDEARYREAADRLLTAGLAGLQESPSPGAAAAALMCAAPYIGYGRGANNGT